MRDEYEVDVAEHPCPECGRGKMWTIIDSEGTAIGESWPDDGGNGEAEAEERAGELNRAFRRGVAAADAKRTSPSEDA